MRLYLGFDCSTQGLTVVAIEVDGAGAQVVLERALDFDRVLPQYGTRHGVLPSDDPHIVEAPPPMWAGALDLLMGEIAASGLDLSRVAAISGSAQQHGSVYVGPDGGLTRDRSPLWMDSSTARECDEITNGVGGALALAQLTGSRAFERFTGPQIRKFSKQDPAGYARTARIHLVSSYMASLLIGGDAPLEPADASGMNLMDIRTRRWAAQAMNATAPGVASKLPAIVDSWSVVGSLASRWRRTHGWPSADIVAWSGDNPCSLVGTGVVREGTAAISLGTSDTVFVFMREPRIDPRLTGHLFAAPIGGYMGLTCFQNGSLARERIRDEYGLDWSGFSDALRRSRPGNDGGIMLPWFEPEITPHVQAAGVRRFDLDASDAVANVRAVVEAQMMAIARHSAWMGVRIDSVRVTGGAAENREILQVMADVLGATVCPACSNAAAVGAALRAWHGYERARGRELPWDQIAAALPAAGTPIEPRRDVEHVYSALMLKHEACERRACR